MKTKTIRQVLAQKHADFCASITCAKTRQLVMENSIITGGCIVSMLLGEKVNDFDVYFTNKETVRAVADYYVGKFLQDHPGENVKVVDELERISIYVKSRGMTGDGSQDIDEEAGEQEEPPEQQKYLPVFLSSNAISLSGKIQLIIRFYGTPEETHKNFDFAHCISYWTSYDRKLVLPAVALEKILTKELSYIGSLYPLCSLIRTRKFIQRGWSINAGAYLKMCFQVSKLDLSDIAVLRDQITGVDSAYFAHAISALEDHKEKDPTFEVTQEYLFEVIDRIFG